MGWMVIKFCRFEQIEHILECIEKIEEINEAANIKVSTENNIFRFKGRKSTHGGQKESLRDFPVREIMVNLGTIRQQEMFLNNHINSMVI